MLELLVNGKNGKQKLVLPTQLKEITPDYLVGVSDEIFVTDNYSLIALCHREKLSEFIMAYRSKKNQINTSVIPLFVKSGYKKDDHCLIDNLVAGDKLVIAGSDMAAGLHVNPFRNTLTMTNLIDAIDGDKEIYQKAALLKDYIYFVEFKIVANCTIIGRYNSKLNPNFNNPFTPKDGIATV